MNSQSMEIRAVKGPIDGVVSVPGSKSYTQRALLVASLAEGTSRLKNCLVSDDTRTLMDALYLLGASFDYEGDEIVVAGVDGRPSKPEGEIYLGNNGTAVRFLTTVAALGRGRVRLTGDPRLCERPIGALLKALGDLGVKARSERGNGCPPVVVAAGGLEGGPIGLRDIESSQFISSVLIAAPYARRDTEVTLEGKIVSRPYIEMTAEVMRHFGAEIVPGEDPEGTGTRYAVRSGKRYTGRNYAVEGDASSASYFFLAAALLGGRVRVLNLNPETKQGDLGVVRIFRDFGCAVESGRLEEDGGWVELSAELAMASRSPLSGEIVLNMGDMPDMVPTVAVLAAFRRGRTRIANAAHLRLKESNRLEALVSELRKIGAGAEETPDGLIINGGGALHGAEIETYNDHRIAMSFAAAGLAIPGMKILDPGCVAKSFPRFWEELDKMVN